MGELSEFEMLLEYLKRSRGFDFTGYKYTSLGRRVRKRMQEVGSSSYDEYTDYLEVHPEEFTTLFNTILINVTNFFRDEEAWQYIANQILPRILSGKGIESPIRVWSAGCATGQEAYTIAILLAEALGEEQFQERVKIYATDVDEEALSQARSAFYSKREISGLPQQYLETYFEAVGSRFAFRKDLRRGVIFGRHDLVQDAPISRVDLLVCRNTLMYFNHETQGRILSRLHFALNDGGFLFLGKAEMLLTHAHLFIGANLKRRVFSKVSKPSMRDRLLVLAQAGGVDTINEPLTPSKQLRDQAFDRTPWIHLIVDHQGFLVMANEPARQLIGLTLRDLGRPLQDLEISYRPVELRAAIDQSYSERRSVLIKEVSFLPRIGEPSWYEVQVQPLMEEDGTLLGVGITFVDVSRFRQLQKDLELANQALETAYEELQSTVEELETTNEELQSTVEELETTNEELQSTNEELETMNEELQSTNEELETMNDELQRRSEELNRVNAFLESVLSGFGGGVAVIGLDMRVQVWNHRAEKLWGLRAEEAEGQYFLSLDIGLPVEQLRQPIRACLHEESDGHMIILMATNRRGRAIQCKVTSTPLQGNGKGVQGVILLMEEREDGLSA